MKIALVADHLLGHGGAEKTFAVMCQGFPEADIYTTAYNPMKAPQELRQFEIRQLVCGDRFQNYDEFRKFFPMVIWKMRQFYFSDYDVILSSVAHVGRFIRKGTARLISYTYYPFRMLYEPELYPQISGLKKAAMLLTLPLLRGWDRSQGRQVDRFVAISRDSQSAIRKYYGKDSLIVPPPVLNLPDAYAPNIKQDYYILVSRLEPWKQVDGVIRAFADLDRQLVIIGDGPDRDHLMRMATPNVSFVGHVSENQLALHYRNCRALVHPTPTEFVLTPIEANAYGTPAICLGTKGVWDTMVPYQISPLGATAYFYDDPRPESLCQAILGFEKVSFDALACFHNSQKYNARQFIQKLRQVVYAN